MIMKICVGLQVIAATHGLIHFLIMDRLFFKMIGVFFASDIIIGSFHVFRIPENDFAKEYQKSRISAVACLILFIASLSVIFFGILLPLKVAIAIVVNAFLVLLGFSVVKIIKEML